MNAVQAARSCNLIYDSPESIQDYLSLDNYATYEDDDTYLLYGFNELSEYIIFRGTFSAPGWILDIDFKPNSFTDIPGKIHQGFGRGFKEILKWLLDKLKRKPLEIAGHSLGGAFATLCPLFMDVNRIYTFGCPKVGDSEFANAYPSVHVERYVNDLDPVPHVPSFFKHVCPELRIGDGWLSSLLQHAKHGFHGAIREALKDHSMAEYLKVIENGYAFV